MVWIVALLISTFTILTACSSAGPTGSAIKRGAMAPEVRTQTAEGKMIALSQYRGNIVLLVFWDANNPVARKNNPVLQQLYQTYRDASFKDGEGFCVFSVSLDPDTASWLAAVRQDRISWPCQTIDTAGWDAASAAVFGVNYTPRYFLINGNGEIISRHVAIEDLDALLSDRLSKRSLLP